MWKAISSGQKSLSKFRKNRAENYELPEEAAGISHSAA